MRLKILESGQGVFTRIKFALVELIFRMRMPDVVRTLSYRPDFFGKPFSDLVQSGLRESTNWSDGECELFAAFVSNRNQCPF